MTIGVLIAAGILLLQFRGIFYGQTRLAQEEVVGTFAEDIENIVDKISLFSGNATFVYHPAIKGYKLTVKSNTVLIYDKMSKKTASFTKTSVNLQDMTFEDSEVIYIKKDEDKVYILKSLEEITREYLTDCDSQCKAQFGASSSGICRGVGSSPIGMLHVCGTKICDENGNEIYLKGIQVDWNERVKKQGTTSVGSSPDESWFTTEDVKRIKEAGGNVMEIHQVWLPHVMPQRDVINEDYFRIWIDKWVLWCEENQIYCPITLADIDPRVTYKTPSWILDKYPQPWDSETYHQANIDFYDLDNTLQNDNRQNFIKLWKFIANRYKDKKYVMFGLVNEPMCGNTLMNSALSQKLGPLYSTFMEQVVDAIRSTGANQIILIDRPYVWYLSNVHPVNRDNIVWEDHLYVTQNRDINEFKSEAYDKTQRFVYDLGKPLFFGEYGIDPHDIVKPGQIYASNWKTIIAEEVTYLDSLSLCGIQWHQWGALEGEYYDFVYDFFTQDDSDYIIQTVLGGSTTTVESSSFKDKVLWESSGKIADFDLGLGKEQCEGYAEDVTSFFKTSPQSIKIVISDHLNQDRSLISLRKDLMSFSDFSKYPDLYMSVWVMIPDQEHFHRSGSMNLGRFPWEWWRDSNDDAWNFRTGTNIQFRESGDKWFTVGASKEYVPTLEKTTIFPSTDLFKTWEYGKWFRIQWHVRRSTDPNIGFLETWVDDTLVGKRYYGKTAYNDEWDHSTALMLRINTYVTSIPPEFFDTTVTAYFDDIVVATDYVPLSYYPGKSNGVGSCQSGETSIGQNDCPDGQFCCCSRAVSSSCDSQCKAQFGTSSSGICEESVISGKNLAVIPDDWEATYNGGPQIYAFDYNDYRTVAPSIRIDGHVSGDVNRWREVDRHGGISVKPGDRIIYKVWVKTEPSLFGNVRGGYACFDLYGPSGNLWEICPGGDYSKYVYDPAWRWQSGYQFVSYNTPQWTQLILDYVVTDFYFTTKMDGTVLPYPQQANAIIPWVSMHQDDLSQIGEGSGWFSDAELYINPTSGGSATCQSDEFSIGQDDCPLDQTCCCSVIQTSGNNLADIPDDWDVGLYGLNTFIDDTVLHDGHQSIRLDRYATDPDYNAAREVNPYEHGPWPSPYRDYLVNPGDHIVFKCWIKVTSPPPAGASLNDYSGARIGIDLNGVQMMPHNGDTILGRVCLHGVSSPTLPETDQGTIENYVHFDEVGWQHRTIDLIVPDTTYYHDEYRDISISGTKISQFGPWLQVWGTKGNQEPSSGWFADCELYINP